MNVLDLFSGIGGFSLGLERAGMRTVAFCELEPFCQAVLRKHWPHVPIFGDIRFLDGDQTGRITYWGGKRREFHDIGPVDVICGGFPCQDISFAGKGAGLAGERSGLWSEYARIIGELRPRFVIVENVSALLGRGLDRVLGDLASLGYDAEWHCIPACAVGAPHRRDRIWIVAYPASERRGKARPDSQRYSEWIAGRGDVLADANTSLHAGRLVSGEDQNSAGPGEGGDPSQGQAPHGERFRFEPHASGQDVADADGPRLERWIRDGLRKCSSEWAAWASGASISDANSEPTQRTAEPRGQCGQWFTEPDVGRVADGVPARMDRLKSLGNAVVPQIPEIIGRAIMTAENERT